jgi:plasmid stabilization system protein ParE
MKALRYTDSAENDLLEAWLFIAEDNPQAAFGTDRRLFP